MSEESYALSAQYRGHRSFLGRQVYAVCVRWIFWVSLIGVVCTGLPFLAPVLAHFGWTGPAKAIYAVYSLFCHQLPQRSYFLFGSQFTYSLIEIQSAWKISTNPLVLRQFIGNPEMGWKVAWSDRMVWMYTSILIFGLLWWWLRHRLRPLSWAGLILFLLPMAVDGTTHFISDLTGIGQGFRYDNMWLATLTREAFSQGFYMGDAWGSFNSLARLFTGVVFGMGIAWFGYPYLDDFFMGVLSLLHARGRIIGR